MPTLNWIGKDDVIKHHEDVPFRLLEPVSELSCGDADSGNLIVHGDNLHALKALLPRYAGQVKCIYIDPPYNTGNEGWVYNDNVNSPEIRRWLGEVVGKEGETLDRHDRWLSMMYPRLVLLKQFLREDGAIFVSIDDNEVATLRLLMDEIFGAKNFVASAIWNMMDSPKNSARHLSEDHEYVVLYAANKDKWRPKLNMLTISTPLTEDEAEVLKASVTSETAAAAIVEAAEVSRTTAIEFFQTPAELGERFRVPQLALRVQGELALFDDPEVLEYPWNLSLYDAVPTADDLTALGAALKVSEGGEIDIDAGGHVVSRFLPELQRDLGLVYQPENWDEVRIATWLCRNLPEPSLTHASKQVFVAAWVTDLLRREGFTLARANLQKFLIRNLVEARIRELRKQAVGKAFQQALFGDDAATRVAVADQYAFEFHSQAYAPSRDYDGRFGHFDFRKHFYGRMGDFDSKEEFECACQLDMWAQQGHIQFWVRNLVRREGSSFFLQKADGRFYPDFLCQLPGAAGQPGPILAVEYKGADRWNGAEDDRLIGGLWANLSEGRCRFVMVKDKRWDWVEEALK